MNELAIAEEHLHVIAETPEEMKSANQALAEWCNHKIKLMQQERNELHECYLKAKKNRWNYKSLERHVKLAEQRITFYRKIQTALKAGFYIVPNFPVSLFAIRTDRDKPLKLLTTHNGWRDHDQKAMVLPEGEGEYKNPDPLVLQSVIERDEKGNAKKTKYWAESFREIEFPFNMAKPKVMEAASRAMAMKLFDDFGILPGHRRTGDPIIVGRIHDPRPQGYSPRKHVSFIIAWALDTEVL